MKDYFNKAMHVYRMGGVMYRTMSNHKLSNSIHGFLARKLEKFPEIRSEFPAPTQKRGFLANKTMSHKKEDESYQPCLRPNEFIVRNI